MEEIKETTEKTKNIRAKRNIAEKSRTIPLYTYKDRVFRMIFKDRKNLLDLYNAMNGTDYREPRELTVTTLENAVYLGMKNDVSFLLQDQLNLYEHQATENPNMPLRNLFYVSNLYSDLTKDANLYGSRQVKIPEPRFIVFYNGLETLPERFDLKLSDAFESQTDAPALELKTEVWNINFGYNKALMERCKILHDYAVFVSKVRFHCQNLSFEEAVEMAMDECIEEDVLAAFLRKNRAEVLSVSIFEYNEQRHMQQEREEAKEEGIREGIKEGIEKGRREGKAEGEKLFAALAEKLIRDSRIDDLARAARDREFRESLYEEYGINEEDGMEGGR